MMQYPTGEYIDFAEGEEVELIDAIVIPNDLGWTLHGVYVNKARALVIDGPTFACEQKDDRALRLGQGL